MIVYGSSFSPFVRKVLAFAAERGVTLELRQIRLRDPDPAFRAASPLGKMPALVDSDFSLADSTAITVYLDATAPGERLIPDDARLRALTIAWDEFADTELFACGRKLFFNRIVAPLFLARPDLADAAEADRAERDELPPLLDHLEARVPEPGAWLVGARLTLADIAVASPLVNLAHAGVPLDAWPRLAAWAAGVLARPSFADLVAGETRLLAKLRAA